MFGGSFRSGLAGASIIVAVCAAVSPAGAARTVTFDIPAQRLPAALNAFARQAGIQIFFPADRIAALTSPPIKGALSAQTALSRLLAKSGLEVTSNDGTTIVLRASQTSATPKAGVRQDAASPVDADGDAASRAEAIVVIGSPRAGTLKRRSDTVVNTVTELEVKRLPNLDVSDVLARLPGVRRNDTQSGENRYVQIRGLNNAAASQSIDGVLLTNYINGSRATSTELLTSNFVKNVVVTTTVTPDLDENANAAHIALATISGLDGDGSHLLDLRGMVGSNSRSGGALDSQQPLRASATWRGKLDAEGRIGLAVGAGIDRLGSRQDALSTAGFSTVNGALVPNGALTKGETYTKSERISAMARLDFRPTEKLSLFAEYFYLSHDFTTDQRTSSATVSASAVSGASASTGQFSSASANYGFNHADSPLIRDHIIQGGADYTLGDKDTLSARVGVTFNQVKQWGVSTSGFSAPSGALSAPLGYQYGGDSFSLLPGTSNIVANPASYSLGGKVTVNDLLSKDENYFARVDYAHNMDMRDRGVGIKIGAQLKTLDRQNIQRGYARILPSGQSIRLSEVTGASSLTLFDPVQWNQTQFLTLINQRGIPSPDANRLYAADPADSYGQNFSGKEQIADLYGIASYAIDRARVSAGLRAAHTHRELNQYEPDAIGQWGIGHYEQNYWHVLPSVYGFFDVNTYLKLRGAFTKTLERPAINSASRRLITSYDTPVTRSISYSNPYLLPIRSTNFDASAEYYYGSHDAYFSVGAFSKYLRDIPAVSSTQSTASDGVREIISYTSNVTEVNGKKVYGRSRGIEVVWSDPQLGFFPRSLGNLGVTASYDYIVYQTTAINGGGGVPPSDTRLVDAGPRHYFNVSLFYNKGPFAANVFAQEQSTVPSMSYNPVNDRRTKYQTLVDMQASYAITSNVRVMVEARNIFDQDIIDRYGVTNYNAAQQVRNNGRTIWFGAQFTLF
jgi:iron complex outermembrane receptor protein